MIEPRLRTSEEIQGDILAGFRKDYCAFLLLRFPVGDGARRWLNEVAPTLSYTREVAEFNREYSIARQANGGVDPDMQACWTGLCLTSSGVLKIAPLLWHKLSFEFRAGAVGRAEHVGDTGTDGPEHWQFGGPDHPVDALFTIAADTTDLLNARLNIEKQRCTTYGVDVELERAEAIHRAGGKPGTQEHFGFRDGFFQPGIKEFDYPDPTGTFVDGHPDHELIEAGEFVIGEPEERSLIGEPRRQVVVDSILVNGSYQVIRRLRQDVQRWREQIHDFVSANEQNDGTITDDLIGSKLMGRDADGLALHHKGTSSQTSDPSLEPAIDYATDPDGLKAPLFAHVRRMRTGVGHVADGKTRRILRRSIPYGAAFVENNEASAQEDRGIFFIAYMTSIYNQFEWLQRMWASSTFRAGNGVDPVVGTGATEHKLELNEREYEFSFARCVHTTGALYGFVPSRQALLRIASGELA